MRGFSSMPRGKAFPLDGAESRVDEELDGGGATNSRASRSTPTPPSPLKGEGVSSAPLKGEGLSVFVGGVFA